MTGRGKAGRRERLGRAGRRRAVQGGWGGAGVGWGGVGFRAERGRAGRGGEGCGTIIQYDGVRLSIELRRGKMQYSDLPASEQLYDLSLVLAVGFMIYIFLPGSEGSCQLFSSLVTLLTPCARGFSLLLRHLQPLAVRHLAMLYDLLPLMPNIFEFSH